ncbi:MAG: NAD(P)-binding domain-containing protein, partial [Dietzia cercidiphylli]
MSGTHHVSGPGTDRALEHLMMSEFGVTGTPPARLSVGLVSAGRVGTAIGAALERRGHVVSAVVARSERSRELASRRLPEARFSDPVAVAGAGELLILAVPDKDLPGVVAELADADAFRPGHIVVHVAGAVGADVLRPAADAGAVVVAAHPAMTFTGTSLDLGRLIDAVFAVSAPAPVLPIAQALVVEMGGEPLVVE